MSTPTPRTVTFRSQLFGEVSDFLHDEGADCSQSCSALVAIASALATYREEGVSLTPQVFLSNQISDISQLLPQAEVHALGEGPKNDSTIRQALKECAALAHDEWSLYIERNGLCDQFCYGVFTTSDLPLALTPQEAIIDDSADTEVFAITIQRVAEGCVELRGARGNRLCFHFSDERHDTPNPALAIEKLAKILSRDVEETSKPATRRYCQRLLAKSLRESHGALVAVQEVNRPHLPDRLHDAVRLTTPISLANRVAGFQLNQDSQAMARLSSAGTVIRGMLSSDGIVVFRSDASVIAYRAFLRLSEEAGTSVIVGGARRRTFAQLRALVDDGSLMGALFRSQDGNTEFYERNQ